MEVDVGRIRFVFCVHNHQPVGNFDHVIEDAYQRAYLPFLDVMEEHRSVAWTLHNSGCLWEWLEAHHPEYIDRVGKGVAAGRIEVLAGGFYEPVLPALTPEDRRGQIEKMRTYLKARFGVEARGLWLTERVWEPDLPVDLVGAGIAHLPLDDTQLHQVGVAPERVRGSFLTESAGRSVRIFPALMTLRYRVPYHDPEQVVAFLREPFPGGGEGLAVYADDGEKFGVWPGTHKLVYKERWLHRFLAALESASDRIGTTSFAAEAAEHPPIGLVYLPTGSYAEMGEWSLPPVYQEALEHAHRTLEENELKQEADLFLRGGFWRNFFARYPESNWMHMRVLEASGRCRSFRSAMKPPAWEQARDHLWRAQCNCAYWHGVFGGLYLPHLRHGVYAELIRGESLVARGLHGRGAWVAARQADLDVDGRNEVVLENDRLALFLDPDLGGRLVEWDDRSAEMNLINVLSRRPEFYHRQVAEKAHEAQEKAGTIHGGIQTKESGLRDLLIYDWYDRAALTDHFYDGPPDPQRLARGEVHEIGDFVDQPFTVEVTEGPDAVSARLLRAGGLWRDGRCQPLAIEKTVRLTPGERGFTVRWRYRNLSEAALHAHVGVENHVNLLAANAPDRYVAVDGHRVQPEILGAASQSEGVRWIALVEGWRAWHVRLEPDRPVGFCRYPVRTVSLSESGAESNDQGLALVLHFPLELGPGEEAGFELSLAVHDGQPEIVEAPPAAAGAAAQPAGRARARGSAAGERPRQRVQG
jgi:4-alpha-glucanotransferase